MYADYEYYKDHSNAYVSEDDFSVYSQRASDLLDYFTRRSLWDNLPTDETDLEQVKRACCELVDTLYVLDKRKAELSANAAGGGTLTDIKTDVKAVQQQAQVTQTELAVVQRDLKTAFNRIDELKAQVGRETA